MYRLLRSYLINYDTCERYINYFLNLSVEFALPLMLWFQVLSAAHSRVPIYEKGRENILGVLLVKTLIMLDPEVRVPITSLVHNPCCLKQATYVEESLPLFDVLNEFQTGKSTTQCMIILSIKP